jgi:magnesium-transporting ATPase (P-type)
MGRSGTDITRQAADIILADDNFSTIVVAVEEGRKIFDNITKFIVYLLSCNISEVRATLLRETPQHPCAGTLSPLRLKASRTTLVW